MFSTPEQLAATTKALMDSHLTVFNDLAQKTFAGFEKLIELNVSVAKNLLEESRLNYQKMLEAKDPNAFFSSAQSNKPTAEKTLSYVHEVAGIASEVRAELSKAVESQVAEANRSFAALMEKAAKNAPAGSENAFAMFTSAMSKATEGYAQLTHSTKQAAATMESTVANTIKHFPQVATKSTPKVNKK